MIGFFSNSRQQRIDRVRRRLDECRDEQRKVDALRLRFRVGDELEFLGCRASVAYVGRVYYSGMPSLYSDPEPPLPVPCVGLQWMSQAGELQKHELNEDQAEALWSKTTARGIYERMGTVRTAAVEAAEAGENDAGPFVVPPSAFEITPEADAKQIADVLLRQRDEMVKHFSQNPTGDLGSVIDGARRAAGPHARSLQPRSALSWHRLSSVMPPHGDTVLIGCGLPYREFVRLAYRTSEGWMDYLTSKRTDLKPTHFCPLPSGLYPSPEA